MIESIIVGAGSKLVFTLVNSWFHNAEKKEELTHLREKEQIEAHIKLTELNQKNKISNCTRSLCALMIFGTWCFIGGYAMLHPTETDVLIPLKHGFVSRLFSQPEVMVVEGRTPAFFFRRGLKSR